MKMDENIPEGQSDGRHVNPPSNAQSHENTHMNEDSHSNESADPDQLTHDKEVYDINEFKNSELKYNDKETFERPNFFTEIVEWIKENTPNKLDLSKKKRELSKKYGIPCIPTDIEIYLRTDHRNAKIIRSFLATKPTRTGSGVAVIATMTSPINCPHGSCIYCPGGIGSVFGNVPKSYTGKEPSTMRGIRNDYDPYRIIFNRLEQYIVLGQNPDKVEQIVMGGTFTSFPKKYQHEYIYYSFKAFNDFSRIFYPKGELDIEEFKEFFELPGDINDPARRENIKRKILESKTRGVKTLQEEMMWNEELAIRCVGLTIETKPDWAFADQGIEMLNLGTTRIELGIQTVYDDILRYITRGHGVKQAKQAIADLRDLGFKLNFHMMPGLPDVDGKRISKKKDIESLKQIFDDPDYRPDMLKVYPCMVMPGTKLEQMHKDAPAGQRFEPLTTQEAAEIIVEMKKIVPEYCRIMRIQRDIPTYATTAGVGRTNLRQYVDELARKENVQCRCIRCREVRFTQITQQPQLLVKEYDASNGKEFFISMEAQDKILGFVRLRLPPRQLHPAITPSTAIIRELHVYGQAVKIGENEESMSQHKGYGRKLMDKAEQIALSHGKDKMLVISGVGVRGYYRKLGYDLEGPYMAKKLS